ncbi:hypothetical protein T484DRAFT_1825922 [Baffinella frigidus]|nr:hypothetical protein T484DRAFT_1825922 [Cryptophyta sp. CCMP2293]
MLRGAQKRNVTEANNRKWIAENPEAALAQHNALFPARSNAAQLAPPAPPAREMDKHDLDPTLETAAGAAATSSEHALELPASAALGIYVADTEESFVMDMHDAPTLATATGAEATSSGADATHVLARAKNVTFIESCVAVLGKRPRDGEGEVGASSKKACTDTSRAAAVGTAALAELDSPPSVEELMIENSQLQRDLTLIKLYQPAFLASQKAPLVAAARAATDRAERAEAQAKKATEANEETEALLADQEALMERKDKDHEKDNARKDMVTQALVAKAERERDAALEDRVRLQHDFDLSGGVHSGQMDRKDKDHARDNARKDKERQALVSNAERERDAAKAEAKEDKQAKEEVEARLAEVQAQLAEAKQEAAAGRVEVAEAKEAKEEAGVVVAEAQALLAGARAAWDRTSQEELARLQEKFDMYKGFHVGEMERKDEAHARDNARKDTEFAARLAEVEAQLAAAEKEAAAGRGEVIVIED